MPGVRLEVWPPSFGDVEDGPASFMRLPKPLPKADFGNGPFKEISLKWHSHELAILSSQNVARDAASGRHIYLVKSISATRSARRKGIAFEVRTKIRFGRHGVRWFTVFQCPLLFGAVQLSEIVEAGCGLLLLRCIGSQAIAGTKGGIGGLLGLGLRRSLAQGLDLSLGTFNLGLGSLDLGLRSLNLFGQALIVILELAHFITQAKQILVVLSQASQFGIFGLVLAFGIFVIGGAQLLVLLVFGLEPGQLRGLFAIESKQGCHRHEQGQCE